MEDIELTDEQVTYYRHVLVTHTTNAETRVCPVCGVPRCSDWTDAFDRLAAAGQVMTASPKPWEPFRPRPSREPANLPKPSAPQGRDG
jgi:hypothetical protein